MILEKLKGDVVQVSSGGSSFMGILALAEPGVIKVERVARLVPTEQGIGFEKLTDGPFHDFVIIGGNFTMFRITAKSDSYRLYKEFISGITA